MGTAGTTLTDQGNVIPASLFKKAEPEFPPEAFEWPGDCVVARVALITTPETSRIIGCAMKVHTAVGPGLLESAYQECLAIEFTVAGLRFKRQVSLALDYGTARIPRAYVADFVVENSVLVELKCVDYLLPVHTAQVITYLRLATLTKGLIFNFKVARLKDGIRSVILPD
jgi:GxxExxY protein